MRGDVTRLRAGAVLTIALSCALTFAATPLPVAASSISIYIGTGAAGSGGSCSQPNYGTGGGDATPVFADAYDDIVTRGTIFVCAGTYDFETNPETVPGGRAITIVGAGRTLTHLSGGDVRRIVDMADGAPASSALTLRNLHITDGGGDGGSGAGAIYVKNLSLRITNVLFDGSGVTAEDSNGGIITVDGGSAFISNTEFRGGSAWSVGGAIYALNSNLNVSKSKFVGNNAAWGGAIFADGSAVTVRRSRFEDNTAGAHDGAIGVYSGSLAIYGSTFVNNEATAEYGGAVHTMDSDVTITSSRFSQNEAGANGGAVDLCAMAGEHRVRVKNSTFSYNSAVGAGGGLGIFCVAFVEATIVGNRFIDNSAGTDGGGMWMSALEMSLHSNLFSGNEAVSHGGGAAIWKSVDWTANKMRSLRLNDYRGNSADCGGGIAIDSGDEDMALILSRSSRFSDNTATDAGTERVCVTDF